MRLPLLAAAVALVAAGCVSPPIDPASLPDGTTAAPADAAPLVASGKDAIGYLDSYVMTHPFRVVPPGAGVPATMAKARATLVTELETMGYAVELQEYSASGTNVLGFKNGTTKSDEWIVLSAHYDTTESTVYGAWDDGAGTAMLLALAKSLSNATLERTLVIAFFDEEEQGLLGSKAFVEEKQEIATLAANLNFDPPGLNWPCKDAQGFLPLKIIFNDKKTEEGMPGYAELRNAVVAALDANEVPEEVRDYSAGIPIATMNGVGLSGTSDHASFDKVDVPNVFIGSAPTSSAGPAAALTYLLHTPLDTKAQMVARCGGADLLEQAFQVEMDVTLHALLALDKEPALSRA